MNPARRSLVAAVLVAALSAALTYGFWRRQGAAGLAGALAGSALGGLTALASHHFRRRALRAEGPKVLPAMMAATFLSFGLFIAAAVLLAFLWREGTAAVLLSALGIYLPLSFYEALVLSGQGRS